MIFHTDGLNPNMTELLFSNLFDEMHWLKIRERIAFKICLLLHNNNTVIIYFHKKK